MVAGIDEGGVSPITFLDEGDHTGDLTLRTERGSSAVPTIDISVCSDRYA
jgi:hypothetical protein